MTGDSFVHLHVHSEYSLLDGACQLKTLVRAAAAAGMPGLALTDHGVMYGAIDFYKLAREAGINPIIGCEVYQARRSRLDREPGRDESSWHLVLLAQNEAGYKNLMKLVSRASLEGFYYKPRVDWELLEDHHQGLIALSGCLAGQVPAALLAGETGEAVAVAGRLAEIFGRENFFLEMQDHGLAGQKRVNGALVDMAARLSLPLVATNDVHYVAGEQAYLHEVLLCIQTGKTLADQNRLRFEGREFYLKEPGAMAALFREVPQAMSNTLTINERCRLELKFGELYLPDYPLPPGHSPASYLHELCMLGAGRRYGPDLPVRVMERLAYELDVINQMGFAGYFLIVWDLINFARQKGIPVGPGRGSAAGSLVAYCLGITDIDPLVHGLLFERFLNPERVTMPDIDSDFCFERRGEVIQYLQEKYGQDHVAQIITFGTMAAKAAIRDVGRVLGLPLAEVDRIAKMVPAELGMTLEKALEANSELKGLYQRETGVRELLDLAGQLEGTPRHASTHAAGVVISREPLANYLPVQRSDTGITTQFPMQTVEEIGLLKMDILGLRTLTVIGDAVKAIAAKNQTVPDLDNLDLRDAPTYALLGQGETSGVFQLESAGMRNIMRNLKPERFEDLVALVALYRPGPLGSGMVEDFIQRKHGVIPIAYLHPALEPILRETYGVILYQEQVMRIAGDLAGFSMGQADLLRRAMGKKKPEIIARMRDSFLTGAAQSGIDAAVATAIFDLMAHFAGYGFNKSHSAAYALVAYQTAYLKAHYPAYFMAALLTSVADNSDKVAVYIEECRRLGIEVLAPDVNESQENFTVVGDSIRFGLAAVKNVGLGAVQAIMAAREQGKFKDLLEFCERVDPAQINRRVLDSLIKAGCFGTIGAGRAQLLAIMDQCLEIGQRRQADRDRGQISLFDVLGEDEVARGVALPPVAEASGEQLLAWEKETLGLYVSGHPIDPYRSRLAALTSCTVADLPGLTDGESVVVAGSISALRINLTRKGETMAYLGLDDGAAVAEVLVFPRIYASLHQGLAEGGVVVVEGRISRDDEKIKLLADNIKPLPAKELRLIMERGSRERLLAIQQILRAFPGPNPVYLYFPRSQQEMVLGQRFWVHEGPELTGRLQSLLGAAAVVWQGG